MPDDKDAYKLFETLLNYPIDAIRYHFKQFNVWTMFFVTINGGLLAAFHSKDTWALNECILIFIVGYIVSLLFFCCCRVYSRCILKLSKQINNIMDGIKTKKPDDAERLNQYHKCFYTLENTKKNTMKLVMGISVVLMCAWVALSILRIDKILILCIGFRESLFWFVLVTVVSFAVFSFLIALVFMKSKQEKGCV